MNFVFRKIFILVVVAIVAVGAGLFLKAQFFRNDAGALAQATCTPLTYATGKTSTVGVPFNGVENSGTLDFTQADVDLAACAYQGNGGTFIKGLVWNTNLGWINFEETGNYATAVNLTDGTFSGKAYGDNIGYIHMGCINGDNAGSACTTATGDANYGIRVAMTDDEDSGQWCNGPVNKGDIYGYAWTDTVGWMNFCGAHVDLDTLETPAAETPPAETDTTTPPADTSTNPPYMETYPPELPEYQVARVIGNVKGNMIIDTKNLSKKDWISYPIGDPTLSNRERFLRIAKKSSAELTPDSFDNGNTETINADYLNSISADKNGIYYFKRDKNIKKPCKIIFDGTGEIQYGNIKKNQNAQFVTIVSEGCDVYIDRNLRSAQRDENTDQPKSRLGIIAFSDLSMHGERKGGNVYICSRITDIESHLVMDGSLFSYGEENEDGEMDCDNKDNLIDQDNGLPVLPTLSGSIKSLLRNQLTIVGMVLGGNTYGGSVADKPALGTGEIVDTSTENVAKARLFDVNFLRYASVEQNTAADKEDQLCWSKEGQLSKYLLPAKFKDQPHSELVKKIWKWEEICETNFPIDPIDHDGADPQALTTIIYMDPTADLPIFNGMVGKK